MMPSGSSFGEVIEALFQDRSSQVTVVVPGKVTVWDKVTETATITPLLRGRDGSQRPDIPQCPVVFPGAYWDIQVGETGLLIASDEDFSDWWRTGEISSPASRQNHDIGNSVFLPGIRSSVNARVHQTNTAVLDKPSAGGSVLIGSPTAINPAVHQVLLANLNALYGLFATWVGQVDVACGPLPGTGALAGKLASMQTDIGAGLYQSPSVKVE